MYLSHKKYRVSQKYLHNILALKMTKTHTVLFFCHYVFQKIKEKKSFNADLGKLRTNFFVFPN
jgi:hypothetical protein